MSNLKTAVKKMLNKDQNQRIYRSYYEKYERFSFRTGQCNSIQQYEASITRLYHTIEKGLSYINYRAGFGRNNVDSLIDELIAYSKNYDVEEYFYKTALNVLFCYIERNKQCGLVDSELEAKVKALPGSQNDDGGIYEFSPTSEKEMHHLDYQAFAKNRHSIRHFSDTPVDIEKVKHAIELAQLTPSACNRQGWRVRVISDKTALQNVLKNQNGNRGFGQEIDKLLLVTADLRYFNNDREMFQAYIDGGMYAMSLINSLHYECIGTIPLSGSLNEEQDANVRNILDLEEAEVIILFIGVGNYPDKCQTTKSIRHEPRIEII